jgi:hypothetical protein
VAAGVEKTTTVEVTGTSLHVDAGLRTVSVESDIIFLLERRTAPWRHHQMGRCWAEHLS